MKKFLLSFLCFLLAVAGGYAEEVTDVLNRATTGITGTTYSIWSGKELTSAAVYAGQSAGGNESIQLRSTSPSGIITTQSGGKVKKIVIVWNSNTSQDRTLDVYGKNTAYSSSADLYNSSNQGTKLGSIKYGTSTELIIDGDYEYIGLRSNKSAMYLTSISITWETTGKPAVPTLTDEGNFTTSKLIEISCATEGTQIYYTTDGSVPSLSNGTKYTNPFEITTTTEVKAIAVNEKGESDVVTAIYTRVATMPTIIFDGDGTFDEALDVRVGVANGSIAYYTLNGEIPTKESTQYVAPLTIKANAVLKVIAYEDDQYMSSVVEQVFKKNKDANTSVGDPTGTATLVKSENDLSVGDQVVIVASDYDVALSTTQNNNNRGQIAITRSGDEVTLNDKVQVLTLGMLNSNFELNTGSGYLYAASSSSNYLRTQEKVSDDGRWTIDVTNDGVATIKAIGNNTHRWLRYNQSSSLFSCYESGQKNVSLYKLNFEMTHEDYVLHVSNVGWATLYLDYAVTIPEGVTCYVVSEVGEESVRLTDVTDVLPAKTAVIVKAYEGAYTFVASGTEETVNSLMEGTAENEYITEEAYVLANVDDVVALYKVEMNGGVFLNNANKAYLPASLVSQAQNAKALKFNFDTTGMEGVKVETEGKKVIYDLSGRRMNEMTQPGVYIVNGKKMMVK